MCVCIYMNTGTHKYIHIYIPVYIYTYRNYICRQCVKFLHTLRTNNCFKTAIKLHLDYEKALATGALPRIPLGELPLTPDPLPYCFTLSALCKGLEFFIPEYESNSYRNEKFLFWHPVKGVAGANPPFW